jgi:hypothetical protein
MVLPEAEEWDLLLFGRTDNMDLSVDLRVHELVRRLNNSTSRRKS